MDQYGFNSPGQLTASSPEYIPQSYTNRSAATYRSTSHPPERTNSYGVTQTNAYYAPASNGYSHSDTSTIYAQPTGNTSPHSSPPHSPRGGSFIGADVYNGGVSAEQQTLVAPMRPAYTSGSASYYSAQNAGNSYSAAVPKAFETQATDRNGGASGSRGLQHSRPPPATLFHFGNIFLDWKL